MPRRNGNSIPPPPGGGNAEYHVDPPSSSESACRKWGRSRPRAYEPRRVGIAPIRPSMPVDSSYGFLCQVASLRGNPWKCSMNHISRRKKARRKWERSRPRTSEPRIGRIPRPSVRPSISILTRQNTYGWRAVYALASSRSIDRVVRGNKRKCIMNHISLSESRIFMPYVSLDATVSR